LRGQGRFFDDLKLADQLHAAIVRSPHAHADIIGIDRRAALQMPGVHAVLTGADYRGDGLGSLPSMAAYQRRGGGPMFLPPRPAIAFDRVMHIGYPVAVVVADALDQARDAAERVVVEYEPRPGVVSARDAFAPDAPQLYDGCPNNEAYFYQAGDKAKVDTAFAVAAHVVEQRLIINRVTPIRSNRAASPGSMMPAPAATRCCGFQRLAVPQRHRPQHAQDLGGGVAADHRRYRRLLRPARLGLPEIILMLWASRRIGRPVKWTRTRNEAHISDDDARDNIVDAALALERDGSSSP
jgi:carbon-monoxide dehydrogenase large subunit